jgi:hypothetical protein
MRKENKPSPTELPLGFELDLEPAKETWTSRGGILSRQDFLAITGDISSIASFSIEVFRPYGHNRAEGAQGCNLSKIMDR